MDASASLVSSVSASNITGSFVTVSQAARMCGVSASQIRILCGQGYLKTALTAGNHRRISVASIRQHCGYDVMDNDKSDTERSVAVYCRVSSDHQDRAGSLQRQRERLLREASEREGVAEADIVIFQDVASSMGRRIGLEKLVDAIIGNQVSKLYVLQVDRLSRLESTLSLVNHLAESHGVEICYLDDAADESEAKDEFAELMVMLANTVQHATAKMAGRKAARVCRKVLTQETIARAKELHAKSSMSLENIATQLTREGHVATRQDGTTHPITRPLLRKYVFNRAAKLVAKTQDTAFRVWFDANLEPCSGNRIAVQEVYDSYRSYCKLRGVGVSEPNSRLGRQIMDIERDYINQHWFIIGWKFVGQKVEAGLIDTTDSFKTFCERFLVKADSTQSVRTKALWADYLAFCKANKLHVQAKRWCGSVLKRLASSVTVNPDKSMSFHGLRIVNS